MNRRLIAFAGCLMMPLLAPGWGRAQGAPPTAPPAAPAAEETVWHIVRPGETLEQIAARFLGSVQLLQ